MSKAKATQEDIFASRSEAIRPDDTHLLSSGNAINEHIDTRRKGECLSITLNAQQQVAAQEKNGIFFVCAGAGSGKTRIITSRIVNLIEQHGVAPSSILALTFTNKAAKEMASRIKGHLEQTNKGLPFIGTFHSYCLNLLKKYYFAEHQATFSVIDDDDQERIVKKIIQSFSLEKRVTPRAVLSPLSLLKNDLINGTVDQALEQIDDKLIRDIAYRYEQEKRAMKCFDFDDLLLEALLLFKKHSICKTLHQNAITHILIDEYQDTNRIQHELIKEMSINNQKQCILDSLCAVGDEDQSIYSWRGATIENILNLEKDFPKIKRVTVDQNYRSTQQILACANTLIEHNALRNPKKLWSENDVHDCVRCIESQSGYQESDIIASCVQTHNKAYTDQSIAVLYRSHYQSRLIEEALLKKNIPYVIIGGIQFYRRQEIKDLCAYARLVVNPFDRIAFVRALNTPSRGLGEKTEESITTFWNQNPFATCSELIDLIKQNNILNETKAKALQSWRDLWSSFTPQSNPKDFFQAIIQKTAYKNYLHDAFEKEEAVAKIQNIEELVSSLDDMQNTLTTLEAFVEHVALIEESSRDKQQSTKTVKLMTFHAAKGLEFDCIIIPGLEENVIPISRALYDASAIEEERRLFYVGITRAKKHLLLLYSLSRVIYGTLQDQVCSRFLKEVPHGLAPRTSTKFWSYSSRDSFFAEWFKTQPLQS